MITVSIKGLSGLLGDIEQYGEDVLNAIDIELTDGANVIEERAKFLAPVDRGLMRGNIFADTDVRLVKRVVCNSFYAPYIEFGTGPKVNTNGRDAVAAQFKGKAGRGNWAEFVSNIYDWLKRNGYFPATAKSESQRRGYAGYVASRIYRNGIEPQPFFFRALDEMTPSILTNIEQAIKNL
jgi:HK97 gp10 family phage protein